MRFLSLTNPEILEGDEKFKIELIRDEKKKILTLKDNGIGMNHDSYNFV